MARVGAARLARAASCTVQALATTLCAGAQIRPPLVDNAAADRGQQVYTGSCARCHGADARGSATGPDLIRSLPVLHDRARQLHGSELSPLLAKQPNHSFELTPAQVADLSQFLVRSVNRVLRSGNFYNQPTQLLSGDARAGEAYFNGAGGCSKCHSPSGDLAGIAGRMTPAALQQRFVFPQAGGFAARGTSAPPRAAAQVTVTPSSGSAVSGALVRIDDFNVTLKDSSGAYRTFPRAPGTTVRVVDPYAAHVELLDKYTDADIHNLTAYLETLK